MLSPKQQLDRLHNFLKSLQQDRFYGNVEIEYQAGNITRCVKHQSIKLENEDELKGNLRPTQEG